MPELAVVFHSTCSSCGSRLVVEMRSKLVADMVEGRQGGRGASADTRPTVIRCRCLIPWDSFPVDLGPSFKDIDRETLHCLMTRRNAPRAVLRQK